MTARPQTVKVAAFSCVHSPFAPKTTQEWMLNTLAPLAPTLDYIVCLGDLFESDAASVHPGESDHSLEDEYNAASAYLASVRKVLRDDVKPVWLLGNHDDNVQKKDPRRIPKALRSLLNWNKHNTEFSKWRQIPYEKGSRGCFELGQAIFAHGWDVGQNSDELEGIQLNNDCGGYAHRLVVRGHTHRPRPVTQCRRTMTIPLPLWVANAGTMGPLKPDYMARKDTSQWGPALVVVELAMGRSCQPAKNWDAEVLTP